MMQLKRAWGLSMGRLLDNFFFLFFLFLSYPCEAYRTIVSASVKTNRWTSHASMVDADAALDFVYRNREKIPPLKGKVLGKTKLQVKELKGGNTNFNYVVYNTDEKNNRIGSVFVKHAKPFAKGFGESAPMSTERLAFEFYGINEFSKYGFTTLDAYLYDPQENYLVTQFLASYEPFLVSLQNGEVDLEVSQAVGAIMGNCHAGTHVISVPKEESQGYRNKYVNKEHFDLWDKHFFPMSIDRLKNTSKFIQSEDVAQFGEVHYSNLRKYIDTDVGTAGIKVLISAIESVRKVYLEKKHTLIHADLHSNNIMIRTDNYHPHRRRYKIGEEATDMSESSVEGESCDLTKVRMIDFEKFAYGPPGIDLGQFLANYIYFMPSATWLPTTEWLQSSLINLRPDPLYTQFEEAIRSFWVSYIEAFDMHIALQCPMTGISISKEVKNKIIQENLQDAIGFIGWWIFSLVASCPVDVMPLVRPLSRATVLQTPLPLPQVRMVQLKIAVFALTKYHKQEKFSLLEDPTAWIEEIITLVKTAIFPVTI